MTGGGAAPAPVGAGRDHNSSARIIGCRGVAAEDVTVKVNENELGKVAGVEGEGDQGERLASTTAPPTSASGSEPPTHAPSSDEDIALLTTNRAGAQTVTDRDSSTICATNTTSPCASTNTNTIARVLNGTFVWKESHVSYLFAIKPFYGTAHEVYVINGTDPGMITGRLFRYLRSQVVARRDEKPVLLSHQHLQGSSSASACSSSAFDIEERR